MNNNQITCPNCGTAIDIDEILNHQADEKYKKKYLEDANRLAIEKKEFEDKKRNENEIFQQKLNQQLQQKLQEEKIRIEQEQTKKATEKFEIELKRLAQEKQEQKEQIDVLKNQQLDLLKKEELLEEEKKNFELKLLQERKEIKTALEQQIKKEASDEIELRLKQKDEQIDQIRKQLEEANRKATQGSMQVQGETLEHIIEEYLAENFPLDEINEVAKGRKGADCIQIINTRSKTNCGTIIYESKSTKAWSNDWIEKLKQDKIQASADIAVLVTATFPRNVERLTLIDGIWVCSLEEFRGLCHVLRDSLIKLDTAIASQQNKGDKMVMLYDYFTGSEFKSKWTAIREGFLAEKNMINKERETMEKLWSAREKNLEKIIKNAAQIQGDIEGISDLNSFNLNLLNE
jgi:hypothetical protein